MNEIRIAPLDVSYTDYPDPHASAVVVYIYGCEHNCPECHNHSLQNVIDDGASIVVDCPTLVNMVREACNKHRTNKVVLMGGDPLAPMNITVVKSFLEAVVNEFDVCVYTGYSAAYVEEHGVNGFAYIKCGRFEAAHKRAAKKTDRSFTLASPNQDFYDSRLRRVSRRGVFNFRKVS